MTKEHTHTPWIIEYGSEESAIIDARGYIICTNGEDPSVVSDDEMAHIVKCVNMHDELVEALVRLRSDCQSPIDMYERKGPEFTSPQGNEYESTSYVMDKFAELVTSIDETLKKAGAL